MLTQRGYSVGPAGVNGRFNAATESAVASFQADKGLNASGIVNRATWSALRDTT
jgi:peptidoglycan hydrolase-like protein with peptidoglycan-binding domain